MEWAMFDQITYKIVGETQHFLSFTLVSIFLVFPAFAVSANAEAPAKTIQSTAKQVALIELYTSEGCSSCPPADKWLTSLKSSPDLWTQWVPVAFHVDYWNYLGWDDAFANLHSVTANGCIIANNLFLPTLQGSL